MLNDSKNEVNKILISDFKIVFISATPKMYNIINNIDLNLNNNLENIFGSVKYELDWKQAI